MSAGSEATFFVLLPSNSSMEYFPDNTTTKFVTKLPRNLCSVGEWRVALIEIDYPLNFLHVPTMENYITLVAGDHNSEIVDQTTHPAEENFYVPSGIYQSIEELLDTINKLPYICKHSPFKYYTNGHVLVTRESDDQVYYEIRMTLAIARILGFDVEVLGKVRKTTKFEKSISCFD